jgi:hypothetical protein
MALEPPHCMVPVPSYTSSFPSSSETPRGGGCPSLDSLTLHVLLLVQHHGWIPADWFSWAAIDTADAQWHTCSLPPLCPRARYQRHGFGAPSHARNTSHSPGSPFLILHLAWDFLSPPSRRAVAAASPIMMSYAARRIRTFLLFPTIAHELRLPRPPVDAVIPLSRRRAALLSCALLSFDFRYGDLVRWLRREYTQDFRDFDTLLESYESVRALIPNPGQPPIDFDRAFRVQSEGVPLRGVHSCSFHDVVRRISYNNHAPLHDALPDVRCKLAKEEAKSFHMVFPRSIAFFIDGLFIAFMNWVIQKGKGRIVVDPSSHLDVSDTGAINDRIPKPGRSAYPDDTPAVTYSDALERHLINIWNTRITYPREDILQHTDDVEGAFHRIPYHPDMAVCFAYVFEEFLVIPVGMIFGAGDSPSWFGITAEPRSHLAAVRDYPTGDIPQGYDVTLPTPPSTSEIDSLVQAVADACHPGIPPEFLDRNSHAMFVDDGLTAAIRAYIERAVRASVGSAFENYGHPAKDRRGPVLAKEKFNLDVSHRVPALGMIIDTRLMAMAWPMEKLERLRGLILVWLDSSTHTAIDAARLSGLIRHGAPLSHVGVFWSIQLQRQLGYLVKTDGAAAVRKKRWWRFRSFPDDLSVRRDLGMLLRCLPDITVADADPFSFWWRPIGLLIPREPNVQAYSDASYEGLGGWSPTFLFMWRLTRDDLLAANFDMRAIDLKGEDIFLYARNRPDIERGLHINVLELLAIVINTWMILYFFRRSAVPPGGWIVQILADNTSALSWFHYAARCHTNPTIQNLTLLCQGMLALSHTNHIARFQGEHLPGKSNGPADALSRPTLFPSVDSATAAFSQLQTCRFSHLPFALLSQLAKIVSSTLTAGELVSVTTALSTLVPRFLPAGCKITESTKHYWAPSRKRNSRR